jgi:hypothetical protein
MRAAINLAFFTIFSNYPLDSRDRSRWRCQVNIDAGGNFCIALTIIVQANKLGE